jgi:signal transduction histidine kinase
MFMPTSSEFVALCQSQVALLTQGLGSELSIIYLTAELVEGASSGLVPIVVYPETTVVWEADRAWSHSFLETGYLPDPIRRLPSSALPEFSEASQQASNQPQIGTNQQDWEGEVQQQHQIVLPLVHEGVVMGVLVTSREDRPWNEGEQSQIEKIVSTLAIACIIDQRRAWLEHQLQVKQQFQRQQRDLLDNFLHQFRNPMTAIRTFGKLLLRRLRPGDANREVANSIIRESDRLQELLQQFDRVIDLAEADAPVGALRPATFEESGSDASPLLLLPDSSQSSVESTPSCSVVAVLEPLLDSARAIALERNLDLIAQTPPDLPLVQADAKVLREVLSNLIDNALKYTPCGGKVIVQTGQTRVLPQGIKQLSIAISDTGPGIPPQDLKHIFERHYRGVQAKTEIPGTGLGLAIARNLVQQMQGEIEVISPATSSSTNQPASNLSWAANSSEPGTTFVVWLPLANR